MPKLEEIESLKKKKKKEIESLNRSRKLYKWIPPNINVTNDLPQGKKKKTVRKKTVSKVVLFILWGQSSLDSKVKI